MRKAIVLGTAVLALAVGAVACGQEPTKNQAPGEAQATKKPRVWTNDNIDSVRTPSDIYAMDEAAQKEQAEEAKAAARKAAQTQQAEAKAHKTPAGHPALSNPNTVDSADSMIAWEQRDINAQNEFVAKLQQELEDAPESEQAEIAARIQERTKVIEATKKEMEGLKAQKQALEKKQQDGASKDSTSGNSDSTQNR